MKKIMGWLRAAAYSRGGKLGHHKPLRHAIGAKQTQSGLRAALRRGTMVGLDRCSQPTSAGLIGVDEKNVGPSVET